LPPESAVAVWPSRALDSAVRLLHVDMPSNSWTLATLVPPPESPPTTRTLLLSVALLETCSSVAVCDRTFCGMVPVADHAPEPEVGSESDAELRIVPELLPPATSTLPLDSKVAVWKLRAPLGAVAAIQVPALGEYSSAVLRLAPAVTPPTTSTLPLVV